MIWFHKDISTQQLDALLGNTMASFLGMKFTEVGPDYLRMSMPVNERTVQPYGYVHGGANCALIETAGSIASAMVIDISRYYCVGIEINANHLRSVTKGIVTATASPLHVGRTTHVWEVKIHDAEQKLSCAGRITVAILEHRKADTN